MASVEDQLTSEPAPEPRKTRVALAEIARTARVGGLTAMSGAACLWLADAVSWSRVGSQIGWGRWVSAMGASLFVSMTGGLLAGAPGGAGSSALAGPAVPSSDITTTRAEARAQRCFMSTASDATTLGRRMSR